MSGRSRWLAGGGITVAVALVTGIGVVAGSDAAEQVDRFYTSPRLHPERVAPMPRSSPYDWDQPPPSSTTWASATAGQSVAIVGDARGDASDLAALDREVERASAVRVHRPRSARAERMRAEDAADAAAPADVSPDV